MILDSFSITPILIVKYSGISCKVVGVFIDLEPFSKKMRLKNKGIRYMKFPLSFVSQSKSYLYLHQKALIQNYFLLEFSY